MTLLPEPPICNRPPDEGSAHRRRAFPALLVSALLIALAWRGPAALAQSPPEARDKTQGAVRPSQRKAAAGATKAAPSAPAAAKSVPVTRPPQTQRVVFPPPDVSKPPPMLPGASREKMRACADEWSKLKMEQNAPPLWRDFAGRCLSR
jgi:hypothetical protein